MQSSVKLKNSKGMTIVEIMVVVGIMSIVALGTMTLFDTLTKSSIRAKASYDRIEAIGLVNDVLYSPNACRVTLNDPTSTALTFNKTNIDEPDSGEGINITDLWMANVNGNARTQVLISSTDASKKVFGKIEVQSMKLVMDNGTGSNYSEGTQVDRGNLIVKTKIKGLVGNDIYTDRIPLWVKISTNAAGLSTVEDCSKNRSQIPGGGGDGSGVPGAAVTAQDIGGDISNRGLKAEVRVWIYPDGAQTVINRCGFWDVTGTPNEPLGEVSVNTNMELVAVGGPLSGQKICDINKSGSCTVTLPYYLHQHCLGLSGPSTCGSWSCAIQNKNFTFTLTQRGLNVEVAATPSAVAIDKTYNWYQ